MKRTLITTLTPAQQPITTGLIGCEFIGQAHFDAAHLSRGFRINLAAPSRDKAKGIPVGATLGLLPDEIYAGGSALIKEGHPLINAVIITTPNCSHSPLAIEALEQGLHVISDKPLADSLVAAQAMCDKASSYPKLLAGCTFQNLGNPMVLLARHLWETGAISDGKDLPVTAQASYFQGWLSKIYKPGEPGYNQQQSRNRENGGEAGGLGDIGGSHAFMALDFVTAGAVFNTGNVSARLFADSARDTDDNGVMIAFGQGGSRAVLQHSQTMIGKKNDLDFSVSGNKGRLEFTSSRPEELVYTDADGKTTIFYKGVGMPGNIGKFCLMPPSHTEGYHCWLANIYRLFAARIHELETGVWPEAFIPRVAFPTFQDGLRAQRFIDACLTSSKAEGAATAY